MAHSLKRKLSSVSLSPSACALCLSPNLCLKLACFYFSIVIFSFSFHSLPCRVCILWKKEKNYNFKPAYNGNSYELAQLFHPLPQLYSRVGTKNQTAQNVAVARAGRQLCNHPKLLNHQAVHGCLKVFEQTLPGNPWIRSKIVSVRKK